jgi:outer membrane cobalamin receptor
METTSSHSKENRQRLIAAALIFLIPPGLPGGEAEDTIDTGVEEEAVHELSPFPVVGTRIRGIDLEGTLPVVKLDTPAIEATGYTQMDEIVRSLPMLAGDGINDGYDEIRPNKFGVGLSTFNFRGMGLSETLVLLNGLRVTPHSGAGAPNSPYDLSTLPNAAIEKVDVLTDGASAIYGSDAVSGVIDFSTVQYFRGTRIGLSLGTFEGTNSDEYNATLLHGRAVGEKGNLVLSLEYYERNNLAMREYDYSASTDFRARGGLNKSSYVTGIGSFLVMDPGNAQWLTYPAQTDEPTLDDLVPVETGWYRDGGYDTNKVSDFYGDNERRGIYLHYDHQFTQHLQGFLELYYNRSWSRFTGAASPVVSGQQEAVPKIFPAENPFNPFGISRTDGGDPLDLDWVAVRLLQADLRSFTGTTEVPRMVAGLKGDFNGWDWGLAGLWSENKSEQAGMNLHRWDRWEEVIHGVDIDGNGSITRNEYFNPFGQNDPDLIDYMAASTKDRGQHELAMLDGHASGSLLERDSYSLRAATGVELRREELSYTMDPLREKGLIIASEGAQSGAVGSRDVAALYGELQFDYREFLTVQAAGRHEEYSDFGNVTTPKVSASVEVFPGILLRGSYGEGFVAPPMHLIYKDTLSLFGGIDAGQDPKREGDEGYLYTTIVGANPDLEPQTSINRTLGLLLEPFAWLERGSGRASPFSSIMLGINWTEIRYENLVTIPDEDWVIEEEDRLEEIYPSRNIQIVREPPSPGDPYTVGRIDTINLVWINQRSARYEGYDFWFEWPLELEELGNLRLRWDGTWIESLNYSDFGEQIGKEWELQFRWTASAIWSKGAWQTALYFQYLDGVPASEWHRANNLPVPGSVLRINAQVSYSGWKETKVTLGVRNLMNEDPPLYYDSYYGGHPMHPKEMRFWYLRLEKTF